MGGLRNFRSFVFAGLVGLCCLGCGTTRQTDTSRSATEMLLVSQAIDRSVNQLDFTPLSRKLVFFDEKVLDGTTDKGYLASSLRQKLLGDGVILVEDRAKATYVVEARAGCVGTDKSTLLIGVPQMNLPTIMPGQPPAIPEIPLVKTTDQQGVAKIAVFAYNRLTGQAVWQSGMKDSVSTTKDSWVFGTGPFKRGTVQKETDSAMAQLDVFGLMDDPNKANASNGRTGVTQAAYYVEDGKPIPSPANANPVQPASATTPAAPPK
jgi:hypothetical protein